MLRVFVFDPKERQETDRSVYFQKSYNSLKDVWSEELQRINPEYLWTSDGFTKQNFVLAIFQGDEFVAATLFRSLHLNCEIDRDDSYFTPWPKEALEKVAQINGHVLTSGYFAVSKKFRRLDIGGYNIKEFSCALSILYTRWAGYPMYLALTRNSRGINTQLKNFGCQSLGNIQFRDEPSEMLFFESSGPHMIPSDLQEIISRLLENLSLANFPINNKKAA